MKTVTLSQLSAENVKLAEECERLRAALAETTEHMDNAHGRECMAHVLLSQAGIPASGLAKDATVPVRVQGLLDLLRAWVLATPAPRPPRDESVPPPGFCISARKDRPGMVYRPNAETMPTTDAWAIYDAEHGYAPAPAPPGHGAFRALAERWAKCIHKRDCGHDACARELLALCSPVTRSEPTRAEPFTTECASGYRPSGTPNGQTYPDVLSEWSVSQMFVMEHKRFRGDDGSIRSSGRHSAAWVSGEWLHVHEPIPLRAARELIAKHDGSESRGATPVLETGGAGFNSPAPDSDAAPGGIQGGDASETSPPVSSGAAEDQPQPTANDREPRDKGDELARRAKVHDESGDRITNAKP